MGRRSTKSAEIYPCAVGGGAGMLLVPLEMVSKWSSWRSHMSNTQIPEIETERLLLRGSAPGDEDAWAVLLDDADVLRFLPKVTQPIRERAALHIKWCDA